MIKDCFATRGSFSSLKHIIISNTILLKMMLINPFEVIRQFNRFFFPLKKLFNGHFKFSSPNEINVSPSKGEFIITNFLKNICIWKNLNKLTTPAKETLHLLCIDGLGNFCFDLILKKVWRSK
jgi:hypothetical protein